MEAKCLDKLSKAVGKGQKERCGLRAINPGNCDLKGSVQEEKEGPAKATEKEQPVRWKENQDSGLSWKERGKKVSSISNAVETLPTLQLLHWILHHEGH